MKKLAIRGLALVLVLVMCIGLLPALSAFAATSDDLLGTWQTANGQRTFVFKADGTGTYTATTALGGGSKNITWSYDGTTLTITPEIGAFKQISFDGTTLKAKPEVTNYDWMFVAYSFTKIAGPETEAPAAEWVKVTEAPADWSGKYLIVYEEGGMALNGALGADLDSASNGVAVTIADGKIADSADMAAIAVTIAAVEGGYSLQLADGNYIGNGTTSNKLYVDSEPYANTIALSDDDGVLITGSAGTVLRYNATSGQERFRFFKSSTYTSQKPIALYKLAEPATEEPEPEVETVTVHAKVPASWTSAALYAWRADNSNNGAWPGVEMTLEGDWYTAEMPNDMPNVIINNGSNAAQTPDIAVEAGKDLWIVVNDDNSYNLYYSEDEVPVPPQEPDAALVALLNGKYHITFPMMSADPQNIVEFIPDEGGASGVLNILAQQGREVFISYTYSVSGTTVTVNYGEDDPVYVIMNNHGGLNYQDNSLGDAFELVKYEEEPEDTGLIMGENHVELEYWGELQTTFTAPAAGTYYFYTLEGEANAYININDWAAVLEESGVVSIELTEGQTIAVMVATYDYNADTIDFAISTENPDQGGSEPQDNVLVLGDNAILVPTPNFQTEYLNYTFTSVNGGTFILKPTATELRADVYAGPYEDYSSPWIDFSSLPNGYEFTLEPGQTVTFAIGSLYVMGDSEEINLILEEKQDSGEEPGDTTLVLGDNSCQIDDGYNGVEYTFTAPAAGTYVLSNAADEANSYIALLPFEVIDLPYTFTLGEGESIVFLVMTFDENPDEINLVITEGEGEGEGGGEVEPSDYTLDLGDNFITVEDAWNLGKVYTFTAAEAGQYTITLLGGDLKISEYFANGDYWDAVELPYTFTLGAGESISLKIGTSTYMPTDVAFTIAPKGPAETGDNTMVFVLMAAVSVMAMGAVLVIGKKKAI